MSQNRKSKKNFSWYVKRLSNKYGKNSRNNKFLKILHFNTKRKGQEGLCEVPKCRKNRKSNGNFPC